MPSTANTEGVGSPEHAIWNTSYDQNTLGVLTSTEPANGSDASYAISYTNWFPLASDSYGNVQCSISPGAPLPLTVTGGSYSSPNATLNFASTVGPAPGSTIYVSGITPSGYNGSFTVFASTPTSVSYAASSPGTCSGGGTIALTRAGLGITAASQTGGTATLTFPTAPTPAVGGTIVVLGVTNTAYDGTFQVTASTSTTFQYAVSGSPASSSGGTFYEIPGDVSSSTYNMFNEMVTSTNPDEQAVSYSGACNGGTPTYTSTSYYGTAGGASCTSAAPQPWLLACEVVQSGDTSGASPASSTTNYGYGGTSYGGGTDTVRDHEKSPLLIMKNHQLAN